MKKTFVFDLDDTLIWLEQHYSYAALAFMEHLLKIWGGRVPFAGSVFVEVEKISHRMLKEINPRTGVPYGFSSDRFPATLVESYRTLCENGWGTFDQSEANTIHAIGMSAFDPDKIFIRGMVPWAPVVLSFLKKQGDTLILLTKGDQRVQEDKIAALNLNHWFPNIDPQRTIVSNKSAKEFLTVLDGIDPATAYSVGNSFSSDIRPALDAGMKAIFIPCYTWKAESIDQSSLTPDEQKRVITIKEISQIGEIYEEL